MSVQYKVLDTNPPRKTFYFWQLWLFFLFYVYGLQADFLALPLDEGYLAHLNHFAILMLIIIPLLWWLKWLIWRSTHIYENSQLIESIAHWLVWTILGLFIILLGLKNFYHNITEPMVTIVTEQYHVKWLSDCSGRGWCSHGNYLLLDQAPNEKYLINKSTYEWLQHYTYPNGHEHGWADAYKTIKLTYKPQAKVVFDVVPYSAEPTKAK